MIKVITCILLMMVATGCNGKESLTILEMEVEDIRKSLIEKTRDETSILSLQYRIDSSIDGLVGLTLAVKNISSSDINDFSFIALFPNDKGIDEVANVIENVDEPITIKKGETIVVEKDFKLKDVSNKHIEELFSPMKIRYYWGESGQFKRVDLLVSRVIESKS